MTLTRQNELLSDALVAVFAPPAWVARQWDRLVRAVRS